MVCKQAKKSFMKKKKINASVLNRLNYVVPRELQDYIKTKIDETVPVEKITSQ